MSEICPYCDAVRFPTIFIFTQVQERKQKGWEEKAITMAAIGCPNRSGKDLMLLWNDLGSKAKIYKDNQNKTGKPFFFFYRYWVMQKRERCVLEMCFGSSKKM